MIGRCLRATLFAAILVVEVTCNYHNPNSFELRSTANPDGIDLDSILTISLSPNQLPADGLSRTVLTTRIDPASTARTMSFETSLGTLIAAGKTVTSQGGKLTLEADAQGIATVELQAAAQV